MGHAPNEVDLNTLYESLAAEVREVLRKGLVAGSDRGEIEEAAWKAYDAGVRAAHASIESIVAMPEVGNAAALVLNAFLRAAQIGNSIVGSLFAPLWPLVGLTPLSETQALFDRIESLRREVREFTAPRVQRSTEPVVPPRAATRSSRGTSETVGEKKTLPVTH